MFDRETSCAFTGHRPKGLPWGDREDDPRCLALRQELAARLEGIYQAGYRHYICGMAHGCDMFFAQAVLALRDIHSDVSLEAAIPCQGQSRSWPRPQRELYEDILSRCDKSTLIQQDYSPGCMMRRNRYMVDNASLLLACFSGQPGGTMNTILYAQRQGLSLITIEI